MKKLIVMRGISGSGKSTYTRTHYPDAQVFSADHEFIQPDGKYVFDPKKLGEAHLSCWRKTHEALMQGAPCVVVDNTHTTMWEMSPYVQMGKALGYDVLIVRMDTDPALCAKRNVHGVPEKKVMEMAQRFQKVSAPGWTEIVVRGA